MYRGINSYKTHFFFFRPKASPYNVFIYELITPTYRDMYIFIYIILYIIYVKTLKL